MNPDDFTAELRQHFGPGSFIKGTPPDPIAIFPAKHPEVGEVKIWLLPSTASSLGMMPHARITIGSLLRESFQNIDTHLDLEERNKRLTSEIVRFLKKLFADQLLLWRRLHDPCSSKWRECNSPSSFEPIALDNEEYALYLWSAPRGTWRLVPAVLKRGAIRNDVECELLRHHVADHVLFGEERDLALRLLRAYTPEQGNGS